MTGCGSSQRQDDETLRGQKTRLAVGVDEVVEEADIGSAPRHQLRPRNRRDDCPGSCLGRVLRIDDPCRNQHPREPGDVDVGERLDFLDDGCRQVVMLRRHEAARHKRFSFSSDRRNTSG